MRNMTVRMELKLRQPLVRRLADWSSCLCAGHDEAVGPADPDPAPGGGTLPARGEGLANGILLRGIAHKPLIRLFQECYFLRSACLAVHPMYKGLAQLVGIDKIECGQTIEEQFRRYLEIRDDYDFFFIHYKHTELHGEDGNFQAKIEALYQTLPILLERRPGVLAVTGDHSTPCDLEGHFWHPQPVLLHSPRSGSDKLDHFIETSANLGSLGCFEAKYLMRLMQANARMFDKYGA